MALRLWFKASHNLLSLRLWLALSTFSLWLVGWHITPFDTSYLLLVIDFDLLYLALTFLPHLCVDFDFGLYYLDCPPLSLL